MYTTRGRGGGGINEREFDCGFGDGSWTRGCGRE